MRTRRSVFTVNFTERGTWRKHRALRLSMLSSRRDQWKSSLSIKSILSLMLIRVSCAMRMEPCRCSFGIFPVAGDTWHEKKRKDWFRGLVQTGSAGVSWEREQGQVRQNRKSREYERVMEREKEWSNARDMENKRKLARKVAGSM